MVQTEDQYVFIHEALLEAVESRNTEVPADNLYMHVQQLTHVDPPNSVTGMEHEFKVTDRNLRFFAIADFFKHLDSHTATLK